MDIFRDKATILVTAETKIMYPLYRLCPSLMLLLGERITRATRERYRVEN